MRWILGIAGSLLLIDTVLAWGFTSFNFGVIMPAILGLPLLAIAVFYKPIKKNSSKKPVKYALGALTVAYAAFIAVFCYTSALIYGAAGAPVQSGADAVIVLGAGLRGDRVSRILASRLNAGAKYLEDNPGSVIVVSGGQGPQEEISEAKAMRDYLVARGVEPERIIEEDKSTSTLENFAFSKAVLEDRLDKKDVKTVFVTSEFHVYRASKVAEKVDLDSQGIGSASLWYLLPNNLLRECAAICQYALFGKM